MSEYIITRKQIEELNKANYGMQIVTSWLSAYAIFDTSGFPPFMKSQHLAITLPNVVRCRDCKFYRFVDRSGIFKDERHNDSFCSRFVDGKRMEVEPDGFCAWGERKVGEDE